MTTTVMQARLSHQEQDKLLILAYDAADAAVRCAPPPVLMLDTLTTRLRERGASFVTITRLGALRGCIGTVEKRYPLAKDVALRSAASATEDPRFNPVLPDELDEITIQISVLTDPIRLEYSQPEELPALLKPGVDGVIIRDGLKHATFLPQVWDRVPEPRRFLDLLCRKAMLPENAWLSSDLHVETYQVESFQR